MKKIEIDVFRELYVKNVNKVNGRYVCDGVTLQEEYYEETGYRMTKGQYDRAVGKMDKEQCYKESRGNLPVRDKEDFGVNQFEKEGLYYSSRHIELDVETKHDPVDVMLSHGYNPRSWKVLEAGSTGSKIGTSKNDEQYFINTYRRIRVAPKQPGDFDLTDVDIMLKHDNYERIKVPVRKVKKSGKAFKISMNDIHVNSSGYSREVIVEKIEEMREYVLANGYDKIIISFEGDFLHVAGTAKQTVKGTQLSLVGDAYQMFDEGESLATYMIERLADIPTDVYWVLGNHSDILEYALFGKVKEKFRDSEHINFFVDKTPYKVIQYGVQFILVSHGDINIKEMQPIASQRFPKEWAKSKFWEAHLGHIHKENVQTFGNFIVRYQRTPKMTDEWEFSKGWYNMLTDIQAYTIDKERGIRHLHFF